MAHPAGQAASAAKPDRSNADKNDDNATAEWLLWREGDAQGAPSSAAQPAASSKEKPTEEENTPSASAESLLALLSRDRLLVFGCPGAHLRIKRRNNNPGSPRRQKPEAVLESLLNSPSLLSSVIF